jgi:predicted RNA methylase
MVRVNPTRDNRRAYYTKSHHIINYMVTMLELQDGVSVFDPCAGDGALIDGVLETGCDVEVTAYELDQVEADKLSRKYSGLDNKVHVRSCDTLLEATDSLFSHTTKFDRIIANPPYGAWQDYERRKLLRKHFPNLYVRETYSLFLFKCLDLLNDDGRLVFITPDTYLNLHLHENLRFGILTETAVEEIVLFPSKFFPNLSFGYANLSIITLRRAGDANSLHSHKMRIVKGLKEPSQLLAISTRSLSKAGVEVTHVSQQKVYENPSHAFLVHSDRRIAHYINSSPVTVSDIADVVTGFYSGNDQEYLRRASEATQRGKRYEVVDQSRIAIGLEAPPLEGIEELRSFLNQPIGLSIGVRKLYSIIECIIRKRRDSKMPSFTFARG